MNRGGMVKILVVVGALVFAVAFPLALSSIYWTSVFTTMAINCLMVASLRIVFLVGEISLGHVGFMCIGAYSSALLMLKVGLPFAITLPTAGVLAGLVALIIGYPFMRVRIIYFAILTAMTSESIRLLSFYWKVTGGSFGLIGFPGAGVLLVPGLGPVDFSGFTAYYYLTLAVVCVSLLILYRLENSRLGFTWLAIRDASKMAGAVGVNVLKYKVIAFCVACFFAGIGGSLFAHAERALSVGEASAFGVMTTIYLLVYMVVGGKSRFAGPIVGVVVLGLISELIRPVQEYQPMVIGAIAIASVLIWPGGLVSMPHMIRMWVARSRA
jgi:branched-chain amino acid transport system permease protein